MTEYSTEARAAYPDQDGLNGEATGNQEAYDRGRAEAQKTDLAATREAIIKAMRVVTDGEMLGASEQYICNVTGAVANAILASDIIRDERLVKAEAWSEGHSAGWLEGFKEAAGEPVVASDPVNPYRAEADHG